MLPTNPSQEFPPPSRRKVASAVATANRYLNAGSLATLEGPYANYPSGYGGVFPGSEWVAQPDLPLGIAEEVYRNVDTNSTTMPVAREIVGFSAGLVFGEEPELTAMTDRGQAALNDIVEKTDVFSVLLSAAEKAAAYGGVFLRPEPVGPDGTPDLPQVTVVTPDLAIPVWRSGRLHEACFVRVLQDPDPNAGVTFGSTRKPRCWRLLEDHYVDVVDGRKVATVEYALYESKDYTTIGDRVPLEMHPETEVLAASLAPHPVRKLTVIRRLPIDRLGVLYVPNLAGRFASDGSCEGRSDLAGVTDILDAIDKVLSSAREEITLGAPRMAVDQDLLEGEEQVFNLDRRIFVPLNMPANAEESLVQQMEWKLRANEHIAYYEAFRKAAIEAAGYSRQSFGYDMATREDSGPGARERKDKTYIMQSRKRRHWGRKTEELFEILIKYYRNINDTVDLSWGKPPQLSEKERAEIAAMDTKQGTLSAYEITRGRKPNWSHDQIIQDMRRRGLDVSDDGSVVSVPEPDMSADELQPGEEIVE